MRFLDLSFESPEENLAFDEAMLSAAEEGRAEETLRIWESPARFVVLGVSQVLAAEVFEQTCEEDHVPVLRRCSAGGCVLQGPGCLNYSLVLSIQDRPEIAHIRQSYRYILGTIREALAPLGIQVLQEGISDLAVGTMKVSGNAQKRRRRYILHHGTLLRDIDQEALRRYLREPADRPEYRGERAHGDFVTTLDISKEALRDALCASFSISATSAAPQAWELEEMHRLISEKYGRSEWTRRR